MNIFDGVDDDMLWHAREQRDYARSMELQQFLEQVKNPIPTHKNRVVAHATTRARKIGACVANKVGPKDPSPQNSSSHMQTANSTPIGHHKTWGAAKATEDKASNHTNAHAATRGDNNYGKVHDTKALMVDMAWSPRRLAKHNKAIDDMLVEEDTLNSDTQSSSQKGEAAKLGENGI